MLIEFRNEPFGCLKSFSDLNGWQKQNVIVGDNEDARIANFSFKGRVAHGWPSQWHTRYKYGYIEFENGKRFDLAKQTIGGKRVFLFLATPQIDIQWRRQTIKMRRLSPSCTEWKAPRSSLAILDFTVALFAMHITASSVWQ